jgi:aminoglycoside phosphotransferase (APT) family kinase protein
VTEAPKFITNLDGLTPVREAHRFDEAALDRYLQTHLGGYRGGLTLRQFVGGTSNPTFLLESGSDRWVLRKRPPGTLLPSAHQVEREYRVMAALRDSAVPVPRMILFCDDASVIGQTFYLMEMVEGRLMNSGLIGFTPAERRAFYDDFIRVLAALHNVDHLAVGLAEHGRPGNYFSRQIDRWSKQYRAAATDVIPEMEKLMEWMPANVPASDETAIIHGDFRVGNVLVHPTEPRVAAVLDWEISTLGHPLGDLSYHAAHAYYQELAPIRHQLTERGIPTEAEYCERYRQYAGREAIENWKFCVAYNLFRLTAIGQGVYKRGLDGIASSPMALDQQQQGIAQRAAKAWELVQQM